jgi:phenylacetate-CoA ligase
MRGIRDSAYLALEGRGRLVIADAPKNDADFDRIRQIAHLYTIAQFYRQEVGFQMEVYDLRTEAAVKKTGLTANVKNAVGIKGNKNWLPQHREGTPTEGGDQFAKSILRRRIERRVMALFRRWFRLLGSLRGSVARPIKSLGKNVFGDTNSGTVRSGEWFGNDTTWRMVLDINLIRQYGDTKGSLIAEYEDVYPEQRRMVEDAFRCRYFSCYGLTEKVAARAECEKSPTYYVWPTYGLFELRDDQNRPVSMPRQRRDIVGHWGHQRRRAIHSLPNGRPCDLRSRPLRRLRRAHPIVADSGSHRTQKTLVASDGFWILWAALNMHDDTFDRGVRFRFYQDTRGQAVLRLIPAPAFSEDDRRRILRNLSRRIEHRPQLMVHCTDQIPIAARPKAIYVDQRIPGRAIDSQGAS